MQIEFEPIKCTCNKQNNVEGICLVDGCNPKNYCQYCINSNHAGHQARCFNIKNLCSIVTQCFDTMNHNNQEFISIFSNVKIYKKIQRIKKILPRVKNINSLLEYHLSKIQGVAFEFENFQDKVTQLKQKFDLFQYEQVFDNRPLLIKLEKRYTLPKGFMNNIRLQLLQKTNHIFYLQKRIINQQLQKADRLLERQSYDHAMNIANDLKAKFPKNNEVLMLYGELLLKLHQDDEAMEFYSSELLKDKKNQWALIGKINCLAQSGQYGKELEEIERALKQESYKFNIDLCLLKREVMIVLLKKTHFINDKIEELLEKEQGGQNNMRLEGSYQIVGCSLQRQKKIVIANP